MKKASPESGFVILYAVLLTTVVLGIGIILLAIITKQIQLATLEKSSQAAYYAADAGRQCALYYDGTDDDHNAFGYYSVDVEGNSVFTKPSDSTNLECFDPSSSLTVLSRTDLICKDDDANCATFYATTISVGSIKTCTSVTVRKFKDGGKGITEIISNGYNQALCGSDKLETINPRRVQRTIRITKD